MLGNTIATYRKKLGLTQEQLAAKLAVTNQAVSKWETDQCCPDTALLPDLADIFGITIDGLFGREAAVPEPQGLPWKDDDSLHVVLYHGHRLLSSAPEGCDLELQYSGPIRDLNCAINLSCETVQGSVNAGGNVECGDVGGNVSAEGYVECGDAGGNVSAGAYVECGDVGGNVAAGGYVECGDVDGNLAAGSYVECGDVDGDLNAGSYVECGNVGGSVTAMAQVECGDVGGSVRAEAPGDSDFFAGFNKR